jgi:predicted amidohydrolase
LVKERSVSAAAIQVSAHDRRHFSTAWPRIVELVARAAESNHGLIVLPEGTVPGYVLGPEPVDTAMLAKAEDDLARIAKRHGATIVYGSASVVDGQTFNAAVVLGPDGERLGEARKFFLWHFDRRWYAPGTTLAPIETPVGTLGVMICADGRIPTIASTLVDRGAQILVVPTAWVTSGRDPGALENIQADLMIRTRARENATPLVAANKVGTERGAVAYCGKSQIVASDGSVLRMGSAVDQQIVSGEIVVREHTNRDPASFEPTASNARNSAERIAVTPATERGEIADLERLAATSDAHVVLSLGAMEAHALPTLAATNDIAYAVVSDREVTDPHGLVEARLAGVDLFVWICDIDAQWATTFARTRAAELRAYVVVFSRSEPGRAFVCDPDGVPICGTFGAYRLAAFAYDPARAASGLVAPHTDVFAGLRSVREALVA